MVPHFLLFLLILLTKLSACPSHKFACRDFACISSAESCNFHDLQCPLIAPVLHLYYFYSVSFFFFFLIQQVMALIVYLLRLLVPWITSHNPLTLAKTMLSYWALPMFLLESQLIPLLLLIMILPL